MLKFDREQYPFKNIKLDEIKKMEKDDEWREKYRVKDCSDELYIGNLRILTMDMSHKARAERTLFVIRLKQDQLIKIQDYEQRRFSWRFMTESEMKILVNRQDIIIRSCSDSQIAYMRQFKNEHRPDIFSDPELADGMNKCHAFDWIAWEKRSEIERDLPQGINDDLISAVKKRKL